MHHDSSSVLLAGAILAALAGCSEPRVTGNPRVLNPENVGRDIGGTDDIYNATQQAISSLMGSSRARQQAGSRIVLERVLNNTGLREYDEKIVYNKLLSALINNSDDRFIFLNREAVSKERALQESGQVKTTGIDGAPSGADMVLEIEIRRLAGARSDTLQFTYRLTNLAGEIVWTHSSEVKKTAG